MKEKQPVNQKALGREVRGFEQDIWDKWNIELVKSAIYSKFTEHQDMKHFLTVDCNPYIIAECNGKDKVWGIGLYEETPLAWDVRTWKGENRLGRSLMQVRDQLIDGVNTEEHDD